MLVGIFGLVPSLAKRYNIVLFVINCRRNSILCFSPPLVFSSLVEIGGSLLECNLLHHWTGLLLAGWQIEEYTCYVHV